MNPLVSVVIVNRNGSEFIETCLRSVFANNYFDFEVILVDNASTDGSLEYVKKHFLTDSRLRLVENPGSLGPAVGRNRGIAIARGKYVAFLDNDTEVDASWITELVKALEADPTIGAAQSKLLKTEPRDRFDYAGDYLTPFGFLSERSRDAKDSGQFDHQCEIFTAKSAASIVRREVLDKIGGFDEDYYMYLEETDICWRVWLSGYRVVFVPRSVVYHAYGTKKKAKPMYYPAYVIRYYGCRNYISTLIKNLSGINLIRILPLHIASWLILALLFLFRLRFSDFFWIIKGITWNLAHPGILAKKRFRIQRYIRKVKDREFMGRIMVARPLSYYFGKGWAYIYGKGY